MADLLIKESEIPSLDKLIAPIPTQYGLPLVNFFQNIGIRRAQEAQEELKNKKTDKVAGKTK